MLNMKPQKKIWKKCLRCDVEYEMSERQKYHSPLCRQRNKNKRPIKSDLYQEKLEEIQKKNLKK